MFFFFVLCESLISIANFWTGNNDKLKDCLLVESCAYLFTAEELIIQSFKILIIVFLDLILLYLLFIYQYSECYGQLFMK